MAKNTNHPITNTFLQLNHRDKKFILKKQWTTLAEKFLLGRTIVGVRYLTDEEADDWENASIVIHLDDGSLFFPLRDDEGNDAGAIYYQKGDEEANFPVISNY